MKLGKILKACRIDKPGRFRLADHNPAETFDLPTDSDQAKLVLTEGVSRLAEMQQRLYANGRWAVLIVLQGMDAAGKDGVIKHVMSALKGPTSGLKTMLRLTSRQEAIIARCL